MLRKFYALICLSFLIVTACASPAAPVNATKTVAPTREIHPTTASSQKPNEPSGKNLLFASNTLNPVPPADIIREINFYGGMGGCGRFCSCEMNNDNKPVLYSEDSPIEVFHSIGFQICGIGSDEIVHVRVELPDGSQAYFEGVGSQGLEYIPDLRAPKGQYHLVFSGKDWNLEKNIKVIDPDGPRLYLTKDHQIIFYKFHPNENVRLFAYKDGKLIGWQAYRIGSNGELSIKTDLDASFIAAGEVSGEVFHTDEGEWISWTAWFGLPTDIYCGKAARSGGIRPEGYAKVLVDSLPTYDLGSDGNLTEIGNVYFGKDSVVKVSSNAKCFHNEFYWYVQCANSNCQGWVPEMGSQGTYLEPIEQLAPTSAPDTIQIPACAGTKPTRLHVGMNAEVTTSGMAPQLSIRAQPSMSAEKVHVIAAGRDMVILQGPVCADNSYWWYIRSEQGFEGWAREGDNEDYWIDPLP